MQAHPLSDGEIVDRERVEASVPWSEIAVAVHPRLMESISRLARGRALVIGYYASARCGTVIGDLSTSWWDVVPVDRFRRLAPIRGVDVFAEAGLLEVLRRGAPELRAGSILTRGRPTLRLGKPELWLDFLASPLVGRPSRP